MKNNYGDGAEQTRRETRKNTTLSSNQQSRNSSASLGILEGDDPREGGVAWDRGRPLFSHYPPLGNNCIIGSVLSQTVLALSVAEKRRAHCLKRRVAGQVGVRGSEIARGGRGTDGRRRRALLERSENREKNEKGKQDSCF